MASSIVVRCPEAGLLEHLRTWVERMELAPPGTLVLDVSVADPRSVTAGRLPKFRQPEVDIYEEEGAGGVVLSWTSVPAVATIPGDSHTATVVLSPEAARDFSRCSRFFLAAVLIFLVRRAGWHHVHGATWIDPAGRGWLFAGDQRVGKSTTTALLASRGWSVGGDDAVFLARDGDRVTTIARRGPIALREGGRALLGSTGGAFEADRGKTLFTPEELGGSWVQRIRPDVLVFPTLSGEETTAEPIGSGAVLAELVRWSAWVILEPALAQEHLDLLAALGRQVQSYRLRLGTDVFENPGLLMDLTA